MTFKAGTVFLPEGLPARLANFGPAHTSGDSIVFFPKERAAFVGDLVFLGRDPLVHRQKGGTSFGLARNLEGARRHLETSLDRDPGWGSSLGIDLPRLVDAIDDRLASIRALPTLVESGPAAMLDLAADAPRIR